VKFVVVRVDYLVVGFQFLASSHSGRRTFATKLIENGVGIKNVQTLLGHKSIQTTTLYIQENPALLGKISAGMSM